MLVTVADSDMMIVAQADRDRGRDTIAADRDMIVTSRPSWQ
jgi:hypothetical protein